MDLDNFSSCLLVTVLFALVVGKICTKRRSPPGPRNFPLLGRLPAIVAQGRKDPNFRFHSYLTEIGRRFGPVWSHVMGTQRYVVLQSHDAVLEAASGGLFIGRPQVPFYFKMRRNMGVGLSEGQMWRDHKRFMLRAFRQLGMSRPLMEQRIQTECAQLLKKVAASIGQPVASGPLLVAPVANVVKGLLFGDADVCDEIQFAKFIERVHAMNHNDDPSVALPLFFPILANDFFFRRIPGCHRTLENIERLREMTRDMIAKIEATDSETSCYIVAYLQEQRRLEAAKEENTFSREQLVECCIDAFGAGTDTTAVFLQWALYFAARYPDLQGRLREELHRVRTLGETLTFADRLQCPLVRAFVDEVHRFASVAPLGVDRRSPEACRFRGFDIEPDDIVVINYFALNHDTTVWNDPFAFRPDRFLTAEGTFSRSDQLFEFGVGRRACLGVGIATVEIFLLLGSILSQFQVELNAPADAIPAIELGSDGLIRSPGKHLLTFRTLN